VKEMLRKAKFIIFWLFIPALLLDDTAGSIARELWWTNQFSPVDIIPPWFFLVIYHLEDKQ
jgi:quinol-cytochrome oxidoreductase complex cytochrome b subunit